MVLDPNWFMVGCFAVEGTRRYRGPEEAFAYLREEAEQRYWLPDALPVYGINLKEEFVVMDTAPRMDFGYALASMYVVDNDPRIADPFGAAGCVVVEGWKGDAVGLTFGYIFFGIIPGPAVARLGPKRYHAIMNTPLHPVEGD